MIQKGRTTILLLVLTPVERRFAAHNNTAPTTEDALMGSAKQKQFSQPLRLSVKGLPELITSLGQFDQALSRKTLITSELFAKLLTLDDDRLSSLTSATRQAADLLQRALKRAVGSPNAADELLKKLGTAFFSEDHGWRKLFMALSALPATREDIKLLALSKYRNYLLARLAALVRWSSIRAA